MCELLESACVICHGWDGVSERSHVDATGGGMTGALFLPTRKLLGLCDTCSELVLTCGRLELRDPQSLIALQVIICKLKQMSLLLPGFF
jgi:hypothetical protein